MMDPVMGLQLLRLVVVLGTASLGVAVRQGNIQSLRADLGSSDADVVLDAVWASRDIGRASLPLLPELKAVLKHPAKELRVEAARVLCRFGPSVAATIVPAVLEAASMGDDVEAIGVGYMCGDPERGLGPTAIPIWLKYLRPARFDETGSYVEGPAYSRRRAIQGAIASSGEEAYPYIVQGLKAGGALGANAVELVGLTVRSPTPASDVLTRELVAAVRAGRVEAGSLSELVWAVKGNESAPTPALAVQEIKGLCSHRKADVRKSADSALKRLEGSGSKGCAGR